LIYLDLIDISRPKLIYLDLIDIFRPKLVEGLILFNCNITSAGWVEWAYHKMNIKVILFLSNYYFLIHFIN